MIKQLTIICLLFLINFSVLAQQTDTLLARKYYKKSIKFESKGKRDSAIKYNNKAAKIYKQQKIWVRFFECRNRIADLYQAENKSDEAKKIANWIIKESPKYLKKDHRRVAQAYNTLGNIASARGSGEESIGYYKKCIQAYRKHYSDSHRLINYTFANIGLAYYRQKKYHTALSYYQNALKGKTGWPLHFNIGITYLMMEEYHLALEFVNKAKSTFLKYSPESHPHFMFISNVLGIIYGQLLLKDQSDQLKKGLIKISGSTTFGGIPS